MIPTAVLSSLTKSQVNKAGKALRASARRDPGVEIGHGAALEVLLAYRAAHRYPLQKATMGLRSMVATEGCDVEVSQRLKRVATIVDKLRREPTMQLANMQDIAGCRAVLGSIDEVRRVQRRLARNRPPRRISDYIANPRVSGYRGVHVVVVYDHCCIEVQLRTSVMHEWAITVERLSSRLQIDLKSNVGPPAVLSLLQILSEAMALEEAGGVVSQGLLDEIQSRRAEAVPFLK